MNHAPPLVDRRLRSRDARSFACRSLVAAVCLIAGAGRITSADDPEPDVPAEKQGPPNRLAGETSPYLLQHAHNPVDWHPWGAEAFEKAKREKKPIFLSIGYSSCHWCHVMERESFMDAEVAAALNEHFVSIKVDREERPEIDEIYMQALHIYNQLLGSPAGGGWPLSMFLTPDGEPIAGGTYFPPRDTDQMTGFLSVLDTVQKAWAADPDRLAKLGGEMAAMVKQSLKQRPALLDSPPGDEWLDELQAALAEDFDPEYGGFGYSEATSRRPKFPEPSNLMFLVSRAADGDAAAEKMLVKTLDGIAAGGIRDHVGGGFHRYSTDRFWRIPHFEKMLYDNGLLASAYAEAYALTNRDEYRQVVDELIEFALRELMAPEGAFYSSLDADSEGEEGKFYVWTRDDLDKRLSPSERELVSETYGLADEPNFEGAYALWLVHHVSEIAARRNVPLAETESQLESSRGKLLAARGERPRPRTDTKVLTAWNGLMIAGLADSGRCLDNPSHTQAAIQAAEFVLHNLRQSGRLLRTWSDGQARLNGYLEDYAYLVHGLIALHRATGDEQWLAAADELTQTQLELFWDDEGGGCYFTSDDHEALIARSKAPADGATPSSNGLTVTNLLYLADALDRAEYVDRANETIAALAGMMIQSPTAMPTMGVALMRMKENE